jgi:hypothetical protein
VNPSGKEKEEGENQRSRKFGNNVNVVYIFNPKNVASTLFRGQQLAFSGETLSYFFRRTR